MTLECSVFRMFSVGSLLSLVRLASGFCINFDCCLVVFTASA